MGRGRSRRQAVNFVHAVHDACAGRLTEGEIPGRSTVQDRNYPAADECVCLVGLAEVYVPDPVNGVAV